MLPALIKKVINKHSTLMIKFNICIFPKRIKEENIDLLFDQTALKCIEFREFDNKLRQIIKVFSENRQLLPLN